MNYKSIIFSPFHAGTLELLLQREEQGKLEVGIAAETLAKQVRVDVAGADYIFKNLDSDRAVAPLSLEQVFAQAHGADFWIFKYYSPSDFTYESLAGDCDLYADFKAFKDRNIWACNSSRVPYFDIVPFRPDLLLRDIAAMLHPEVWPGYDTRFFGRLKQASRP